MKKEAILLLTLFILSTSVCANCDVLSTFNEGESKAFTAGSKDYNITFSSLQNDSGGLAVKFTVDGKSTSYLELGQKYNFDDLSDLRVNSIVYGTSGANHTAQICFNGGLVGYGKGTCSSSTECEDNNPCTIDECDGDPLRCRHKLILWCRDDDGCCPEDRCTEEKDNDCGQISTNETSNTSTKYSNQTGSECTEDSDCDDNDDSTMDICSTTTKECTNIIITECTSGDNICPEDCTFSKDIDCDECSDDEECNDDNACTTDSCEGSPKRCSNKASPGCNLDGECIPVKMRKDNKYCDEDNIMKPLKPKKEPCNNDYECLNNECIKNKCKSPSFINNIVSWIKGLFSK